jgi:hypothetical protein
LILSLPELPHGLSYETIEKTHKRLRNEKNRDVTDRISEDLGLLEQDE